MNLPGIDVSGWQHPNGEPINWAKVRAAGKRFAWIKASQGLDYTSPYLAEDALEAHAAGVLVGAYHYAAPGTGTPAEQAQYLLRVCHGLFLPLGYALDLETQGTLQIHELAGWAEAFLGELKAAGVPRVLYTLPSWITPYLYGAPWGAEWWLPDNEIPAGIAPTFLQALGAGQVDGVPDDVDLDTCTNPRALNPGGPPPPPPPPPAPETEHVEATVIEEPSGAETIEIPAEPGHEAATSS